MIVAAILSLPFVMILATRPVLRRLAFRNAARRPRESLLVIVGSMLATALMTASFVIGDTFTASNRDVAFTKLGPIDEVLTAVGPDAGSALFSKFETATQSRPQDVDGIETMVASAAAMAVRDGERATAAAPRAQLLELDFRSARAFGGDSAATGISRPTPPEGRAVIANDLARKLQVSAGDRFTAFAYGRSVDLIVDRTLPNIGLAGFWLGRESSSYNAFVAPGTIAELATSAATPGAPPSWLVLVSNRGGVLDGATRSDSVREWLESQSGGLEARVTTVKQDVLDEAKQRGDGLTTFYSSIAFFAVMAGILLLINIFLMLAAERRAELGMMRAMGLRRRDLVAAFASEGWLYAIVASVVGTVIGVGVGRLVTKGAERIINSGDDEFRIALRFSATPASLERGFTIGLFIAVATVVATSIATSRFNIIAAIRDLDRPRTEPGGLRRVGWSALIVVGLAATAAGFAAKGAVGILVGPALVICGVAALVRGGLPKRAIATTACVSTLVWGVAAVPITASLDVSLEIQAFIVQGVVLVVAAVLLVNEYQNELGHLLSRASGRSLAVRLGLAYPLARRGRTALTLGQFAIVVFILTYVSVMANMFANQTDEFTRQLSGGYNVTVRGSESNPVPWADLDTERVAPLSTRAFDATVTEGEEPRTALLTGFDESLVAGGAPELEDRGEYESDADAYRAVLEHENFVIVDQFFLRQGPGPPNAVVGIGDRLTVADPQSGRSTELTVIAEGASDWVGNGALVSSKVVTDLAGASAVPNRAYVRAADAVAFADAIEAKYFANGAEAATIASLVDQNLSQQNSFFTLMRSFLAVGLVIGIAGIGVIMVRAVRERRRQVGVLRALGFPADSVANAFAIEAGFVALEGVLIGVALGFVCTWSITLSSDFGEGLTWSVPILTIGVLVIGTMIGALAATIGPARSAAKIKPAVALRIAD